MKFHSKLAHPIGILALGLVLIGGSFLIPPKAHAMSLREEINALKATVEDLRSSLGASVYKSTATSMTTTVSNTAPITVIANVSTVTSLKLGAKSDDVKKLQEKLSNLGYYKGVVDGSYGNGTADAVKAYQFANKLIADGVAGAKTLSLLGITLSSSTIASVKPTTTPGTTPNFSTLTSLTAGQACFPGMTPWVQVISPNGNETYTAGQQITVKWKDCNINSDTPVQINLARIVNNSQTEGYTLLPQNSIPESLWVTTNDGQEIVSLPPTGQQEPIPLVGGSNFKVSVSVWGSSPAVQDYSDNFFTINASESGCDASNPQLTVLSDSTTPASQTVSTGQNYIDVLHFKVRNNSNCDISLTGFNPSIGNTPPPGSNNQSPYWFHIMDTATYFDEAGAIIGAGSDTYNLSNAYVLPAGDTDRFSVKINLSSLIPQGIILPGTTFRASFGNMQATNSAGQILNGVPNHTINGFPINGNFMTVQ